MTVAYPRRSVMANAPIVTKTFIDPKPDVLVATMTNQRPLRSKIGNAAVVMGPAYIDPNPVVLTATFP